MKKIITLLLCALMVFALAGCQKGGDTPETTKGADKETETTKAADSDDKGADDYAKILESYRNVKSDNITWEWDEATKTLYFSGEGKMKSYAEVAPDWDIYNDQAEKIVIGDDITSVGDSAFLYFQSVDEVVLGNSVECICPYAFDNCWELTTVSYPNSLKYIDERAFYNDLFHAESCNNLPEGLEYIGDYAFHSSFKEGTVKIPASVKFIGKCALSNCFMEDIVVDEANTNYKSIEGAVYTKSGEVLLVNAPDYNKTVFNIPEGTKTIAEEAMEVSNTLEKIVIPASLTTIEEGAIFWNYALETIEVNPENKSFIVESDALYTADGKTLVVYPTALEKDEYKVKEGTDTIGKYALSASRIKHIIIPEGVKKLNDSAFDLCYAEEIDLPESLETIEISCFRFNDDLIRINYAGSEESWNKIKVDEGNDALENVEIIFGK